jgi:hypothetical protein
MVITGKTALFEPQPSLEDSAREHRANSSFDFATIIFLGEQGRQIFLLRPNLEDLARVFMSPPVRGRRSYTPMHRVPFS